MTSPAYNRQPGSAPVVPVLALVHDIAHENTRAVLRAARAHRHLLISTINGPFRCWQCDTSRAYEVDECESCGEVTSAYADRAEV